MGYLQVSARYVLLKNTSIMPCCTVLFSGIAVVTSKNLQQKIFLWQTCSSSTTKQENMKKHLN